MKQTTTKVTVRQIITQLRQQRDEAAQRAEHLGEAIGNLEKTILPNGEVARTEPVALGHPRATLHETYPPRPGKKHRKPMSAEARANISRAMKKRWRVWGGKHAPAK